MNLRAVVLPGVAALLVALVLGIQVANGGGDFVPAPPRDPCATRAVEPISTGDIESLGERLVWLGLDGAACHLHISREALVLQLAQPGERTDAEVNAIRTGLLGAVDRMKADGTLPPASDFTDEALASANLSGLVKWLILRLPDGVVNAALPTDDVLRRAINDLDIRALMTNLNNTAQLNQVINAALTKAVRETLIERMRSLLTGR